MLLHPDDIILNGKYKIIRLIGEGGMARVWLAEEPGFGNRQVALKEPADPYLTSDPAELERRFDREIQLAAQLVNVPNVVRTHTLERLEDSTRLLVMAYMPGGDLAARIKISPAGLPIPQAVQITIDLCQALAGVHGHDWIIVHRDVKPSNILFDVQGQAHLADFGLAQIAGLSNRTHLIGGAHPGTPLYAAPEQLNNPAILNPAADIYALGCVLFEMLTGRRYKQVRPGTPAGQLRPDLPTWLDQVLARALVEDPWERYQTAKEMLAALEMGLAEDRASREAADRAEAAQQRLTQLQTQAEAALNRSDGLALRQVVDELEQLDPAAAAPFSQALAAQAQREQAERERLAHQYNETQKVLSNEPKLALTLIAQIRARQPDYPGLVQLEQQAKITDNAIRIDLLARLGQGQVESVAWSPDGRILAVAISFYIYLYDATAELGFIDTGIYLKSIAFSPDGAVLACAGEMNREVQLWRISDRQLLRAFKVHSHFGNTVYSVVFSPDGNNLATGSSYGIQLWRVSDGQLLRIFTEGEAYSVAFSPGGTILASGFRNKIVDLWQVNNGQLLHTLGHQDNVMSVVFSPDRTTLASADDRMVRLWRVNDGQLLYTLMGHTNCVGSVAFSPDGTLLASGSYDGTVRFWRVSHGKLLYTFAEHTGHVRSVAFSPDGTLLASGSGDGTLVCEVK